MRIRGSNVAILLHLWFKTQQCRCSLRNIDWHWNLYFPCTVLLASINLCYCIVTNMPWRQHSKTDHFISPPSLYSAIFTNNASNGSQAEHPPTRCRASQRKYKSQRGTENFIKTFRDSGHIFSQALTSCFCLPRNRGRSFPANFWTLTKFWKHIQHFLNLFPNAVVSEW